jgi:FtsH-binding integral membrane protein
MVNQTLYNTIWGGKQTGGGVTKNISALFFEKRELLAKTFANLIVQGLITFYAMKKYSKEKPNRVLYFLTVLSTFVIILVLALTSLPSWIKFLLFCIFSYGWGYILSNLIPRFGEEAIHIAILGSLGIFGIMFFIGTMMLLTGIQLGFRTGVVLFFCLFALNLANLIQLFTSTMGTWVSVVAVILFSIYFIYDTNMLLQKNYYGDFITASIDYYLDIINLFVNLLSLNQN